MNFKNLRGRYTLSRPIFAGKVEGYDPAPECKGVNAARESQEPEGETWPNARLPEYANQWDGHR